MEKNYESLKRRLRDIYLQLMISGTSLSREERSSLEDEQQEIRKLMKEIKLEERTVLK